MVQRIKLSNQSEIFKELLELLTNYLNNIFICVIDIYMLAANLQF